MQLTVRFSHSRRLELAGFLSENRELRRTPTKRVQDMDPATVTYAPSKITTSSTGHEGEDE